MRSSRSPHFSKSFTQQDPIPDAAIARAVEILRSGRLHRYNVGPGEESEASALEREYAAWQGAKYCVACASGGYAMQLALRAAGLQAGDLVLANAWTLAPVPGAIHNIGGIPVFVEINESLTIDVADLRSKAVRTGAKFLMLSHMRGHIGDMEAIVAICHENGITMIEDCAHTMGARWHGIKSGNFGSIACFSTQTYKHINSGEGGLLTTNDPEIAAKAVLMSGSYMNYAAHGAIPELNAFANLRLKTPNYSGRMDNLRAGILRPQLPLLEENIGRWNTRYRALESGLAAASGLNTIPRPQGEAFVGSSLQFHCRNERQAADLVDRCAVRGVDIKWFGSPVPVAFTSRFDSWAYLGRPAELPNTLRILSTTCDLRIPLTFNPDDCETIALIISEEAADGAN